VDPARTRFDTLDFLTDGSILDDPVPYYTYLRACPVQHVPPHGVVAVTGYDEVIAVWRDPDAYSSVNSSSGPFPRLPMEPGAVDVTDLIEEHRAAFPINEHITSFDPPKHAAHRALLMRLMTPKRLEDSEPFMRVLADRLIDEFHGSGRCEFIADYAYPYALLSIANLLGVPEDDHRRILNQLLAYQPGSLEKPLEGNPFAFMEPIFLDYVEDRRRSPRPDVITGMATATFPDGTLPEPIDVVRIAVFLFAAGQGTTAHLMGMMLRHLAERPELQATIRTDRDLVMPFIEETLRFDSPTKSLFRMARQTHELDGCPVAAGDAIMVMPGAANRDERRFERPDEFVIDRPNVREHVAFGRGIHACPGGALARAEARISLNRVLDRLGDIRISETQHGAGDGRHYDWKPSFLLRGLEALHLEFVPL
jgi:cytochrome P450